MPPAFPGHAGPIAFLRLRLRRFATTRCFPNSPLLARRATLLAFPGHAGPIAFLRLRLRRFATTRCFPNSPLLARRATTARYLLAPSALPRSGRPNLTGAPRRPPWPERPARSAVIMPRPHHGFGPAGSRRGHEQHHRPHTGGHPQARRPETTLNAARSKLGWRSPATQAARLRLRATALGPPKLASSAPRRPPWP